MPLDYECTGKSTQKFSWKLALFGGLRVQDYTILLNEQP